MGHCSRLLKDSGLLAVAALKSPLLRRVEARPAIDGLSEPAVAVDDVAAGRDADVVTLACHLDEQEG